MKTILQHEEDSLREIRKDLVDDLFVAATLLGGGAQIATTIRNTLLGLPPPPIGLYLVSTLFGIFYLARRWIPAWVRSVYFIAAAQIVSVSSLARMGVSAPGSWHLVSSVIQAWMLLPRAGAWLATFSAFAIFGVGAATLPHPPQNADLNPLAASWANLYILLGLMGVLPLVTARRLLLQLARRQERAQADRDLRFELLEALHEGVLVLDVAPPPKARILEANRSAERLLGVPRTELVGTRLLDHFPGTAAAPMAAVLAEASSEALVVLPCLRADGSSVWVEIATNRHPVGDQDRLLVSLRDIDDRIHRQAHLRRSKSLLEKRVEDRSRELEKSHEEIRAFSYAVSHDLRAPLRAAHGFAQALWEDYQPRLTMPESDLLNGILADTAWMHQEIELLLELSRLERKGLHPEAMDMRELVRSTCEELADSSTDLVWAARTSLTGDWPICTSDREALTTLWSCLIADAIRVHPDRKSPIVRIHAETTSDRTWYTLSTAVPVTTPDAVPRQPPRNALCRLLARMHGEMRLDSANPGSLVRVRLGDLPPAN